MTGNIGAKSLIYSDLLAITGGSSYDAPVSNEEFWRAVGEFLMLRRTRMELNPIDIDRQGGPNYGTVQSIEKGDVGQTKKLEQYATELRISLADLFRAVLDSAERKEPPSPELQQIIRKFHSTDVRGRQALVAMVQALPDQEHPEPNESPGEPQH